jgi:enamine deaminase RidA (YjgF/YER057c/UK114 family)
MNREIDPKHIAPPAANYAHAVLSTSASKLLHISGTVGTRPDGTISDDVAEQAAETWRSLQAICDEAGMGLDDIVQITTYAVTGQPLGGVMAARDAALGGRRVASVLITVPALARPEWKMEIAAVAAR